MATLNDLFGSSNGRGSSPDIMKGHEASALINEWVVKHGTDAPIKVDQTNRKMASKPPYARYQAYKAATTIAQYAALGGTLADLQHDVKKGWVVLNTEAIAKPTVKTPPANK